MAKKQWPKLREVFELATQYRTFNKVIPDLAHMPRGDGHPVLFIPGFTAPDLPTYPMRRALNKMGYKTYGWRAGVNLGLQERTAQHLAKHLKKIYEQNGNQKVSLIGHSMGGLYARNLAREFPEMVRDVTTLGTPFGVGMNKELAPAWILELVEKLNEPRYSLNNPGMSERLLTPPSMPTTSIFSKTDAVVGWQACLNPKTRLSENIEVQSGHLELVCNKQVLEIILDRLAQPEGAWTRHKDASKDATPPNPKWKPSRKDGDWRLFPQHGT